VPDFSFTEALAPYQPVSMKVSWACFWHAQCVGQGPANIGPLKGSRKKYCKVLTFVLITFMKALSIYLHYIHRLN